MLTGIVVNNGIVLVDYINLMRARGLELKEAIIVSGKSRLRPVLMTSLTTILGMLPLLGDAFFESMAVTIMFGLGFATVLTLIIVPVLYTKFYRIPYRPLAELG